MATSKQRKRKKKQRRDGFYEAMPAALSQLPTFDTEKLEAVVSDANRRYDAWLTRVSAAIGARREVRKARNLAVAVAGGYVYSGQVIWAAARQAGRTTAGGGRVLKMAAIVAAGGFAYSGTVIGGTTRGAARWTWPRLRSMTIATAHAGLAAGSDLVDLARDLGRGTRRVWRKVWHPRARALYVAVVGVGLIAAVVTTTSLAGATYARYAADLSSPAAVLNKKKTGTTILDRNGVVLYDGFGAQSANVIPLSDLPDSLKKATLAAEDPSFYDHPGVSWQAMARAAWVDVTQGGKVEGGSTLTQQLVKNAILNSNKTFERKFQEIVLSVNLEQRYSKDQILEMYLNEVYYGQGSNGVEAASQAYFKKSARDLSLSQAAFIAGLPLGPSRFDPNLNAEAALGRRNFVLDRMANLGYVSRADSDAAKAEPLNAGARDITIKAPHFVFYVLDQLRRTYGDDLVEHGGITVKTTLDITKQDAAQSIVAAQIAKLSGNNVTNAGLISLQPSTGDILAMVGSVGYDTPGFGAVNVTLSNLQPGSSFKPIAYVTAFTKGWNGSTEVDDVPIREPNGDGTFYEPQNYDQTFRGKVTLRRALTNSLNIPAVKVLQYAGMSSTLDMAHKLGVTGLNDPGRYGLSLVLGGGEVKPIDMATVYATFANNGTKMTPRSILSVTDRFGADITKADTSKPEKVLDPKYASMISDILSDNRSRTEEFGANSPLALSRPAAAKTGTTNDFRDNWTVGYTPGLATAVWVGNNDHSPMNGVDGITGAAPIWHDYMEAALAGSPVQAFTPAAGLQGFTVCRQNGGIIAGDASGNNSYTEYAPSDAPITRRCSTAQIRATPSPSRSPEATGAEPETQSVGPFFEGGRGAPAGDSTATESSPEPSQSPSGFPFGGANNPFLR